jgi:hypothetical protein
MRNETFGFCWIFRAFLYFFNVKLYSANLEEGKKKVLTTVNRLKSQIN